MLTLKWLCVAKCPWTVDTFASAVKRGDMEILKWLREKKCPWSEACYKVAIDEKNGDVLEWLHKEGCPRSRSIKCDLRLIWASHEHQIYDL